MTQLYYTQDIAITTTTSSSSSSSSSTAAATASTTSLSSSTTSTSSSTSSSTSKNSKTTKYSNRVLKTSSLLTCMDNSQFTAQYFDVRYYPDNKTVVFKVDATTTIDAKIIIDAEVIAYGLQVLNMTINPCSLGQLGICPLSPGRIDVESTYVVDSDATNQIPSIAYTIPDLDAQVRVIAYSVDDVTKSNPLACVQAILSNGKTVQTKYASWPIAAISGVGILTSGFVSVIGYSSTATHIASNSISLFIYFQNLAITAMMGVSRVPPIAAAWTQNFQWSMGIIYAKFMQNIFNWYVQSTNGISTVVISNKDILSISVQKKRKRGYSVVSSSDYNFDALTDDSSLYTTNERNSDNYSTKILVLRGIQRVAYLANIELSNLFLTGIVIFLFFLFVVVVSLIFFKSLLEVLTRARLMPQTSNFFQYRKNWGQIIKGTLYRLSIIAFPQICLLTIWEFTQLDSPAVVVDAVIILIICMGLLIYGTTRVLLKGVESKRLYKTPAYLLYGDTTFLNKFGFLYVQFKADTFWWLLVLLCYSFLRSLFVAVLQENGKAQAMIIFIIELFYFIALCWIKPYLDKRTNIFNIAIHLVNLINAFFFLFFSNIFNQAPIVSSVMAIILFILNAVFALFLLIFTVITCALALVHRNPDIRYQPMKDDRVSFIPKMTNGDGMIDYKNNKSEAELFELRQAVLDTNETEKEKELRDDAFTKKNQYETNSNTFDYDFDNDSGSVFNSNNMRSSEEFVQPFSTINNNNNTTTTTTNNNYLSVSNRSASYAGSSMSNLLKTGSRSPVKNSSNNVENLKKPETTFYGNNHSYSRDFL
ncbi:hypothetical protein RI543_001647 [Arxiozyma heterogenica]|uniref:ML-like domain-containing protein n=1 Tax=Arxiozyma heterogenica TaxID=278026 RepID=A0AAN7WNH8_9SACH|nr:hypothetical protein RI543_001647 [Kazachstania heterogenica]